VSLSGTPGGSQACFVSAVGFALEMSFSLAAQSRQDVPPDAATLLRAALLRAIWGFSPK